MNENGDILRIGVVAMADLGLMRLLQNSTSKKSRQRRWYVRKLNISRRQKGAYGDLVQEMRLYDPESHFKYYRMSKERFDRLLTRVGPSITYGNNHIAPIGPAERLSMTIRALASGDGFESMAFHYRCGHSTASVIFNDTCRAIWNRLKDDYLKSPTRDEWRGISQKFYDLWNFPNCLGALDGKHVTLQAPPRSGSTYFNYKGDHSIVLLAVADAEYVFTFVDVGGFGRQSDGCTFSESTFGRCLLSANNELDLPAFAPLPSTNQHQPFVFVADDAFASSRRLLKPLKATI